MQQLATEIAINATIVCDHFHGVQYAFFGSMRGECIQVFFAKRRTIK